MKKLLIVAVLFVVGTLGYWGFDWLKFEDAVNSCCQKVDNEVHRLGQKLAKEGLWLSRPFMETEYKGHRMSKMDHWGELSYRADRIYDPRQPWKERESPTEVLNMVIREYALGVFYKGHPDVSGSSGSDAFKEAKRNPGWTWLVTGDSLLRELNCSDWEVNRARSWEELQDVQQRLEAKIQELEKHLEKGPPSVKEDKSI